MLQIRVGKKSHQDPGVQFIADTSGPDRATKTQDYDLLRVRVGQKEPPRPGRTICYGYAWARRSHQEPGVRFVTDKTGPDRATKTREYDLLQIRVGQTEPPRPLRIRVGQKEPPIPGSTICYGKRAIPYVDARFCKHQRKKTHQWHRSSQQTANQSLPLPM